MGFAVFTANVAFPQILELPVESGSGLGITLTQASLVVMSSGIIMMLISPVAGLLMRIVGPQIIFTVGTLAVATAYVFLIVLSSEVWYVLVASLLLGLGIGLSYAAMPMLIMRAVPASDTGAANGLNILFRNIGGAAAAAVTGTVLASHTVEFQRVAVPTPEAFAVSFWIASIAALIAFVLTLMIPRGRPPIAVLD